MFELPTQPQSIFGVFKSAFSFLGAHYVKLLLISLLALVIATSPGFLHPELNSLDVRVVYGFIETHWLEIIIFSLIMFFIFAFIIDYAQSLLYEKSFAIGKSFHYCLRKFPSLVLAMIIYNFFVVLGFVLLVVPGIVFAVFFSLSFVLIITDDLGAISALKKSWKLVSNNWWRSFCILIIMFVTIGVLMNIIRFETLDFLSVAHPAGHGILRLGNRVLRVGFGSIFYAIFVSILLMLQHDLKLRNR